jgi:hypothetical protein
MDTTNFKFSGCFYLTPEVYPFRSAKTEEIEQRLFDFSLFSSFYIIDCIHKQGLFEKEDHDAIVERNRFVERILGIARSTNCAKRKSQQLCEEFCKSGIKYDRFNSQLCFSEVCDKFNIPNIGEMIAMPLSIKGDQDYHPSVLEVSLAYLNHERTLDNLSKYTLGERLSSNWVPCFMNLFLRKANAERISTPCLLNILNFTAIGNMYPKLYMKFDEIMQLDPGFADGAEITTQCARYMQTIIQRKSIDDFRANTQIRKRHKKIKLSIFIALSIIFFLIGGFGLFMNFTNYIIFNLANIAAPCIAAFGFIAAAVCIVIATKKKCDCYRCSKMLHITNYTPVDRKPEANIEEHLI